MKIEKLIARGFRGFNRVKSIDFDQKLTLIYAPNSYGKTSISEAVEWLLYGITTKLQHADSIEEYKGSYRNCHFPETEVPYIEIWVSDKAPLKFRAELTQTDEMKKLVNDKEVDRWPLSFDIENTPKPFVLQHALKYLLLVKPDARFRGFARLLGLDELDDIQRNIVSLCTKPEARMPGKLTDTLRALSDLETRLSVQASLNAIYKECKKNTSSLAQILKIVKEECSKRVVPGTKEQFFLSELKKKREHLVSKVFRGEIIFHGFSDQERTQNKSDEEYLSSFVSESFIEKYLELIKLAMVQTLIDRAGFYELGKRLYDKNPTQCPFCEQLVDADVEKHIFEIHSHLMLERDRTKLLEDQRESVLRDISVARDRFGSLYSRLINKVSALIELKPSLDKLKDVLAEKHKKSYQAVENSMEEFEAFLESLGPLRADVLGSIRDVESTIKDSKEDAQILKKLAQSISAFLSEVKKFSDLIDSKDAPLAEAKKALKIELDSLAGTEDISILIDFIQQKDIIKKSFRIRNIVYGLKGLKLCVEQYVARKMLEIVSGDLTADVKEWYDKIRTTGDPDVHFDGFDMERTKEGKFKSKRIKIKAKSYDKELVSAVSSLSESKLNALGLCVSIAANLQADTPFDFLLIDDPIQSWDAEHESQFIEVIKKLVAKGKQIILLSHNLSWIKQLRAGCRSLNGRIYKIDAYTIDGPDIEEYPWEEFRERLQEIDAITKSSGASTVRLQQAEEEIRIVVSEITSELYFRRKNVKIKPKNLNAEKTRKTLIECGIRNDLVDRIFQTFETVDDSHHAPTDYVARKERIKMYHSWCHELAKELKD